MSNPPTAKLAGLKLGDGGAAPAPKKATKPPTPPSSNGGKATDGKWIRKHCIPGAIAYVWWMVEEQNTLWVVVRI